MSDDIRDDASSDEADGLADEELEQVLGGIINPDDLVNLPGNPPPFVDPSTYEF